MAGDWIKMRTTLAAERATLIICERTGLDPFSVVGRLHAVWVWAGQHTSNGVVRDVTLKTIDRLTLSESFGEAMVAADWLSEVVSNGVVVGIKFPRWNKYHSKSERARELNARRQRRYREKQKGDVTRYGNVTSNACNALRQEETRGEPIALNTNGKAIGKSPDAPLAEPVASRLPRKIFVREGYTPDLSDVDWGLVVLRATIVGKKIPPLTETDRRNYFRYGVLSQTTFSEAWLMDAVDAVLHATERKRTRQAHLYGVLRSKAIDEGIERRQFAGLIKCIEIPDEVWDQSVLEIRK